jgi:hypothetical protein
LEYGQRWGDDLETGRAVTACLEVDGGDDDDDYDDDEPSLSLSSLRFLYFNTVCLFHYRQCPPVSLRGNLTNVCQSLLSRSFP